MQPIKEKFIDLDNYWGYFDRIIGKIDGCEVLQGLKRRNSGHLIAVEGDLGQGFELYQHSKQGRQIFDASTIVIRVLELHVDLSSHGLGFEQLDQFVHQLRL